ncbi:hypothetical protein ACJIZ3_008221 [Penstemon smallii]|uniref:Uncharacterized protein n=1 Tax=Penstemon smallii TaxID=265156 RepID=A0ABD3TAB6_9LAMI
MMNHAEKFEQRWDFRRRNNDGDSSDDSKSNSPNDKKPNLITDLILLENDEVSDTPISQPKDNQLDTNNNDRLKTVEAAKKKIKQSKKKNPVKNKPKKSLVKEKKARKRNINIKAKAKAKEVVMFDDLKVFSDSLIQELKVARETMFAKMKEETRKLMTSSSRSISKKKVRRSRKTKVAPQNGIESSVKPQNVSTKTHIDSDQVVSSSQYLTLPTVVPKPQQLQSHRNSIPFDAKNYCHGIRALQPEPFGSLSHISCENVGFLGQNGSESTSLGVGFPIAFHQGLENGSNISSQTYLENAFRDNSTVGTRMNVRFPGGSSNLLQNIFPNNINNNVHHKIDGQFFSSLRNKE